jgi:hypothetical protein
MDFRLMNYPTAPADGVSNNPPPLRQGFRLFTLSQLLQVRHCVDRSTKRFSGCAFTPAPGDKRKHCEMAVQATGTSSFLGFVRYSRNVCLLTAIGFADTSPTKIYPKNQSGNAIHPYRIDDGTFRTSHEILAGIPKSRYKGRKYLL